MTFTSLPSCFGEPLGDVMHWMLMCGNYRYLTTRYSYPPKRAMFLLLPHLLLFLTVKLLFLAISSIPQTLANALKSMENTSLEIKEFGYLKLR